MIPATGAMFAGEVTDEAGKGGENQHGQRELDCLPVPIV